MIRAEIKKDLEAIVVKLDDAVTPERQVKAVLLTVLGAIDTHQEAALLDHVVMFSRRLLRALAAVRASRN
jgi:hypothetical protein